PPPPAEPPPPAPPPPAEPPKPEPPPAAAPPPQPAPAVPPSPAARPPRRTADQQGTREPPPGPAAARPPSTDGQEPSLRVEGAELPPDWLRQLQAWWDVRAYYPPEAAQKNLSGNVKVHMWVRPDGRVWKVDVVESSGSKILDAAGYDVFFR